METLKFADSHNMVTFLSKPTESEGFEQIMDFLNAHLIKYALKINPTIYIACIEQFWSTVKAKTIKGEQQLHALMDGKKVIITKSIVRRDLQLEDEEGVDCLPNATIFEQLTLMKYEKISQKLTFYKAFFSPQSKFLIHTILQCLCSKTTAWNEFSSTMTFAIICLATNQKFNFSKYIFESMLRNIDNLSGKFLMYQRKPKRKDTQVPQPSGPTEHVADEAVHKERGDGLVRAGTTASSLEVEQNSGNITKSRSKATLNEPSSLGTSSGSGPRCQETMGDTIAQTRFENVSKLSNDSLLARGNTLRSDEDSLKLNELMELCTILQQRVHNLEQTKTSQHNEIDSLKKRVKKLEKRNRSRTHKLKRLYKVGLTVRVESYGDEESLDDADKEMFDMDTLTGYEVFAEQEVAAKDVNLTIDEVTLAQALAALKSVKPKVKGDVIEEPSVPVSVVSASIKVSVATTTTAIIPTSRKEIVITELGTPIITRSSQQPSHVKVQDKGKGILVEPKMPLKKKDQLKLDEDCDNP
ncbi:hypothetical protein Tco_1323034 [Tanacetum coccineum]